MECAFGLDFSGVKIHLNTESDKINRSLHSLAFTTGQDIFFRQGAFNPRNSHGRTLIAHELTHVAQQRTLDEIPSNSALPATRDGKDSESHANQPIIQRRVVIEADEEYEGHRYSWPAFVDELALGHVSGLHRGDSLTFLTSRALSRNILLGMAASQEVFRFETEGDLGIELARRVRLVNGFIQDISDHTIMALNRAHREIVLSQPQLSIQIVEDMGFSASQFLVASDQPGLLAEIVRRIRQEFILDPSRSGLELLPPDQHERYLEFSWALSDFPGVTASPHEERAREMHHDLGRILPERRPNQGPHMIVAAHQEPGLRPYIVSELRPVPPVSGDRPNQRLNRHALDAYILELLYKGTF